MLAAGYPVGVSVGGAENDAFVAGRADGNGVRVIEAGQAAFSGGDVGYGLWVDSAVNDGVHIEAAGGDGLYVEAAAGDGVQIVDATGDGLLVENADGLGISVSGGKQGVGVADHVGLVKNTDATTGPTGVLALQVATNLAFPNENFVTFFNGTGTAIGAIEGNGSGDVVYKTSGADYAEFLPRESEDLVLKAGDVVGVRNGRISLVTSSAQQVLVITDQAAVLGNSPGEGY